MNDNNTSHRTQYLLTNGHQTAGNIFSLKNDSINKIQKIIRIEIEKYQSYFKDSKEGFLKSWPTNYSMRGWLVSMKSGGKLSPHIHEDGWISGSIYINVPEKLNNNSGNLVVALDKEKDELDKNVNIIDVVTGSLCLFPSSLHHYTIPFEAKEERIVLAFDVIPGKI